VEQFTRDLPRFDVDVDGFRPRTRLGIVVDDLTPQLAEYFGAKEGVLVTSVTASSAAERAGLKAGDVITAVNSIPVRSRSEFVRQLRDVREGDATLGIVRDKKAATVKATIEPAARASRSGRPA
jgi:S1-C subfamily serine protease